MPFGPLQLVVVGFESPTLDGSVLGELATIREQGFIRLVDVLAVHKDEAGDVWSLELSDLTDAHALLAGAAIGALIGLGAAGVAGAADGAVEGVLAAAERRAYGVAPEDIMGIADQIPAGGAALLMLVEHKWLTPLRNAIRTQGGVFITHDFLSAESLIGIGEELAQVDE